MRRSYLPTAGFMVLVLGLAAWAFFSNRCGEGQTRSGIICVAQGSPPNGSAGTPSDSTEVSPLKPISNEELQVRFSRGDRVFFRGDGNLDRDKGVEFFQKQDYQEAIESFTQAIASIPNDPESRIYLNNARALKQTNPYTLAVVVPVESRGDVAKEILRGVADAQIKFNDEGGKDNRLLEILIVDDAGKKELAQQVASQLTRQSEVLGVIGHNSSDTSLAALPEYESATLAVISPTATSTELKGDVFFRTLPSDGAAGEKLARYAKQQKMGKVVIFFDSDSRYSSSLKASFEQSFQKIDGKVVRSIDFSDEALNREEELKKAAQDDAEAAVLLPSVAMVPRAIAVARSNTQLPPGQKLRLLGGDVLYDNRTLINGGAAVKDLVLVVSWIANTPYAEDAKTRWGGRVSWRTANSYDAAQALIKVLSKDVSRTAVLKKLRSVNLSRQETAGNPLKFESTGDRVEEPLLVQAVRGGERPIGSDFGFRSLP
jgi:branched-chain amino acid transport system substrate-binding protein